MQTTTRFLPSLLILALLAGCGGGCSKPKFLKSYQAKGALKRGDAALAKEDLEKAEIEYGNAYLLGRNPKTLVKLAEVQFLQGRNVLFLQGQAANILGHCVINVATNDPRLKFFLGRLELEKGGRQNAWILAVQALRDDPGYADALLLLVDSMSLEQSPMGQQQRNATQAALKSFPEKARNTAIYHVAAAWFAAQQRNVTQADTELQSALAIDPKCSEALARRAMLLGASRDYVNAEKVLRSAVDLAPLRSNTRILLSRFLDELGNQVPAKREEAIAILTQLTTKAPDYVPGWNALAVMSQGHGLLTNALSCTDEVLQREPSHSKALLRKGDLLLEVGDAAGAVAHCKRVLEIETKKASSKEPARGAGTNAPPDATSSSANNAVPVKPVASPFELQLQMQLARAYLLLNDPVNAVESVNQAAQQERALSRNPTATNTFSADLLALKAEAELQNGNPVFATNTLPTLVKAYDARSATNRTAAQRSAKLRKLLVGAYAQTGNYDKALEETTTLLAGRSDPEALWTIGELRLRKSQAQNNPQDLTEARALLEQAAQSPTNDVWSYRALTTLIGMDLFEKHPERAVARAEQAFQRQPNSQEIAYTRAAAQLELARALASPGDAGSATRAKDELNKAAQWIAKASELGATAQAGGLNRELGILFENLADYPAARACYEKALSANPGDIFTLNNLAYLYADHFGMLDEGYKLAELGYNSLTAVVRTNISLEPLIPASMADTFAWLLYQRGKTKVNRDDIARARSLIEESSETYVRLAASENTPLRTAATNGYPEVLIHRGLIHYALGSEQPALDDLQRGLQRTDLKPELRKPAGQAVSVLKLNVPIADQGSETLLRQAVSDFPNDPPALRRLASLQSQKNAYKEAAQSYEAALKLSQNPTYTVEYISLLDTRLSDTAKALAVATQAAKQAPEDPAISAALGRLLFKTGDFKRASDLLDDAARKLPQDARLAYDLAWAKYSLGDVDGAKRSLTAASKDASGSTRADAEAFLGLVDASQAKTVSDSAVAAASKTLAENSAHVPALMVLALHEEQQQKPKEAKAHFEQALAKFPSFIPAARKLVPAYIKDGEDEKASVLLGKLGDAVRDDPDLATAYGVLLYRRGDIENASRMLSALPDSPTPAELKKYADGLAVYQLIRDKKGRQADLDLLKQAADAGLSPKLAEEVAALLKLKGKK